MYNISLRMVGNEMEAEDVMQESFLSAFKKIDSYEGKVSFGAWLKKIVINRSLDHLKKKKIVFEEINEKMNVAENPEFMEIEESSLENIKNEIRNLPEKYRVVLSLFLIDGYSHEEVSEILNISNETSRTQFFRAKQKLKELLKQKEIFSVN